MIKKRIALLAILILIPLALMANDTLKGYDFTFYKTVSESLGIANKEKFGFDYTGFGFLGEKSTSGVFVRFGLQTPYLSIISLVKPLETTKSVELDDGILSEVTIKERISDITLSFVLGSAKRYIFDQRLDFYLGYGFNIKSRLYSNSNIETKLELESSEFTISFDIDAGVKFLLKKNHSIRIGVYATYSLFGYYGYSMLYIIEDQSLRTYSNQAIFLFAKSEFNPIPLKFTGYISMGTTFTNKQFVKRYKYSISKDGTKIYQLGK